MTAPAISPTIDDFVGRIAAAWRRGVEAILETGALMCEARAALDDPAWAELCARLPFGPPHARRLVRIGVSDRLRTHVCALPSDIEALDKITALSDERFAAELAADRIHPGMSRGDLDTAVKQAARAARELDLAAATRAANAALAAGSGGGGEGAHKKYNVIYADPPWRLEP